MTFGLVWTTYIWSCARSDVGPTFPRSETPGNRLGTGRYASLSRRAINRPASLDSPFHLVVLHQREPVA